MITNYQILADSSCDLPFSLARSLGVSYAPLRVQFQERNMRILWTAIPGVVWTSRRFTAHSEPARLPAPQPLTRRGGAPS